MGKYEELKGFVPKQFRRLTGVKRETFDAMVKILSEAERYKRNSRRNKAGRRRVSGLSIEDRLLIALEYLREYRTYFHLS